MDDNLNIEKHASTVRLIQKQDKQIVVVNNILATRKLSDLLIDKRRVEKAIDLAWNARLKLDPFYDPFELHSIDKSSLVADIITTLNTADTKKSLSAPFLINVPKNKISSRSSRYLNIKDYSIRFLLSKILSEKIKFPDNIFGGRDEVFSVDDGTLFEMERVRFQSIQNSALLSGRYSWVVYIDISSYYECINKDILIKIIENKLLLVSEEKFVKLLHIYLSDITIGCWCDNFLQNIYFNNLDAVLNSHGWTYFRMTDDIRIFCKSKEEAELALQIIKTELAKLKLSINRGKHFVVKPMTSVERFETNREDYEYGDLSPILELSRISEYPVENIFTLFRDSEGREWINHKYENRFPRKFTYRDELLEKTGFQINGIDVKEIIIDVEQRLDLSLDDYSILFQIIFNTYSSYQFKKRVVRLFLIHVFSNSSVAAVDEVFIKVLRKLTSDCCTGSNGFLSYNFLQFMFLDREMVPNQLLIKRHAKAIWNWFYQMIINNDYRSSYLLKVARYIIEHSLFRLVHHMHGEVLSYDKFWGRVIDKEAELKKEDLKYRFSYTLNSVHFLQGLFPSSSLLNLKRADYYYKKEQYSEALQYFLQLLSSENLTDQFFKVGYCYYHIKDYKNAIFYYSEYLKKYNSSTAYNNRGVIYKELKQFDEALLDFDKAIDLEISALYFENRAACFMELSQFDEALVDLDLAIEIKETNDPGTHRYVYRKRAKVKKELGDVPGAIADIELYCNLFYYSNPETTASLIKELLNNELEY